MDSVRAVEVAMVQEYLVTSQLLRCSSPQPITHKSGIITFSTQPLKYLNNKE